MKQNEPASARMESAAEETEAETAAVRQADAFTELVRANEVNLRQFAYQLTRDPFAMEELLQEGLLRAYLAYPAFSPQREGSVTRWLCRIIYHVFVDEYRRRKRRPPPLALDAQIEDSAADSVDDAVTTRLTLDRALGELSLEVRTAVMLVDVAGFDYAAAAEVAGTNPGTIASRLHRGRAMLLKALEKETTP
jgi:RNA polymerase sigma factor (sigma-70 family)